MARNAKNTRMCAGCMQRKNKSEFLCIRRLKSGEVVVAPKPGIKGRSAYLCYDAKCLDRLIKRKALSRSFKCNISDNLYDNIKNSLKQE